MKKTGLFISLLVLVLLQVALFLGRDFFRRAGAGTVDNDKKISLLGSSIKFFPWQDRAWLETGRALSEKAADNLGDQAVRDAALAGSVKAFDKGLGRNPVSVTGHLYLGQALLLMNYMHADPGRRYFDEYRKAARLTGHNTELYFESGKVLLSKWADLKDTEKAFTRDILKKALAGKDLGRLSQVLEIWLLHGGDPQVMESVMPEDPAVLRFYAGFLGGKSFTIEPRLKALASAERLEFDKAGEELNAGRRGMDYYRPEKAAEFLVSGLKRLNGIRFYGDLTNGGDRLDPRAVSAAKKGILSLLATYQVEKTGTLSDPEGTIAAFMETEDDPAALGEFEKFLRGRGVLAEKGGLVVGTKDLETLAFELDLDFRQHRFRDIVRVGEALDASALVIPPDKQRYYVKILDTIGSSLFKLDYIYEAEKQLRKALELEPANLETLLGLDRCYARLNEEAERLAVRRSMAAVLTPAELFLGGEVVERGAVPAHDIICDGSRSRFELKFESLRTGQAPLVTVVFNGKVVREAYLADGLAVFEAGTRIGPNRLEITPVNCRIRLNSLAMINLGEAENAARPGQLS